MLKTVTATFLIPMLAAVLLVPFVMRLARRWNFVDLPGIRKVHLYVTPLLGGVAVYAAVFCYEATAGALVGKTAALLAACGGAVILGTIDDRFDIQSRFRLSAHVSLAAFLVAVGFRSELLPIWLDVPLSILWIAGMINAINCLDCADGVVGGMAAIALMCYGVLLLFAHRVELALLSFAFSGACCGFLAYNLPPARLFLGDCGSTALGILLGAVSLRATAHARPPLGWYAALPVLLPVADIILVHVRRYLNGTTNIRDLLASAGKDHLPHRLLALGCTTPQMDFAIYFVTALLSGAAILVRVAPPLSDLTLLAVVIIAILFEREYVRRTQRSEPVLLERAPRPALILPEHRIPGAELPVPEQVGSYE